MSDFKTILKRLILVIGDVAILYFSLWLALLVRYLKPVTIETWQLHFLPFSILFVFWILIFYINNLYDLSKARNNLTFNSTLFKSLVWGAATAMAFFYLIKPGVAIAPKTNLFLQIIFFSLLFLIWRRVYNSVVKVNAFLNRVLILGLSEQTIKLAMEVNAKPQIGYKVIAIIDEQNESMVKSIDSHIDIIHQPYDFKALVLEKRINTIVTALDPRKYPHILNELYRSLSFKLAFFDLTSFAEKFTGKIPVSTIGQIWFLENFKAADKIFYEGVKRLVDFLLALIVGMISLPFVPLLALIIKLDSRGPVIFRQIRVGKNGKNFRAMKFRSMYHNAENNGPQWATVGDPRITKSGRFLRKTRIDEIPQLWNILKGEMSFVGPRPERPEFVEQLMETIPFYNERHLVKPGLSGWAQINFPYGSSAEDSLEKLQYDLYYVKNRSLALDLSILLKTIKIILSGEGR